MAIKQGWMSAGLSLTRATPWMSADGDANWLSDTAIKHSNIKHPKLTNLNPVLSSSGSFNWSLEMLDSCN